MPMSKHPESGDSAEGGLESLTKADLLAKASELNVEGRSHMTKDELIAAIEAGGGDAGGVVAPPGET
jgi:hypothetical protein